MQTAIDQALNSSGRDEPAGGRPRVRRGPVRSWARLVCCLAACGLLSASARVSPGQSGAVVNTRHEYNVKAAFLYGFGRYIEWHGDTFEKNKGAFTIGVLGEDPFGGALDRIARQKKVQGRTVVIRRWKSFDQYEPCHILFVPRTTNAAQQSAASNRVVEL